MSKKLFKENDIFISRVKMHPACSFYIQNQNVYINKKVDAPITVHKKGNSHMTMYGDTYKNTLSGSISLYELNINRPSSSMAYPFIIEDGFQYAFKTGMDFMTGDTYDLSPPNTQQTAKQTYPLTASITRMFISKTTASPYEGFDWDDNEPEQSHRIAALHTAGRKYSRLSKRFLWTRGIISGSTNLIDVPSIFYGSAIKRGSVNLKYYVTGSLLSSARDENENGELICDYGVLSGSVIGLVYYTEGIFAFPQTSVSSSSGYNSKAHFTSSWFHGSTNLVDGTDNAPIDYDEHQGGGAGYDNHAWLYFGTGANDMGRMNMWKSGDSDVDGDSTLTADEYDKLDSAVTRYHNTVRSASFGIDFEGTSYKNTLTLFCHADKGEMNFSNNPSFTDLTGSYKYNKTQHTYSEYDVPIKNVVSSSYENHEEDFRKVTYITKIGIYDEDGNLIMVADMARPYRKEENKDLTFKLKYDLL